MHVLGKDIVSVFQYNWWLKFLILYQKRKRKLNKQKVFEMQKQRTREGTYSIVYGLIGHRGLKSEQGRSICMSNRYRSTLMHVVRQ